MEINQDEARKNAYEMSLKDLESSNEHATEIIRQLFTISTILLLFVGTVIVVLPKLIDGCFLKICVFIIVVGSSVSMISGILTLMFNKQYFLSGFKYKFELSIRGEMRDPEPKPNKWIYLFNRLQTGSVFAAIIGTVCLVVAFLFSKNLGSL